MYEYHKRLILYDEQKKMEHKYRKIDKLPYASVMVCPICWT